MKTILSYGAGVNSTAIMALVLQGKLDYDGFEVVFCDTGSEKPETYCYLEYIQKQVPWKIRILKPNVEGCTSIEEYCLKWRIVPLRFMRWCTDKFKIRPFRKYTKEIGEFKHIIGIDYGEKHRAKDPTALYPLIDLEIDRDGCKEIIKEQGWEVPVKSGCYFCPFARKGEFWELKHKHPDLWARLVKLENAARSRHPKALLKDKPIEEYIDTKQSLLEPYEENQHCLCRSD